ncbi:apolipoprotein D-like [Aedes aegypti]|uniref:Lipocalin/cytosolic fatty-acid binding domain-containing protein n=1 Tax=Aedes aegypti TaxID=7159 RepID=A0A6I8TYR8_AEDAE|nr:apolipoprotein D-like [Aedes aegypti]
MVIVSLNNFRHLTRTLVLLFLCSRLTNCQVLSLGKCPYFPVEPNFKAGPFLGLWYEQEKYPNLFQIGGKCNTVEYNKKIDGTLSIINRHENQLTGIETGIRGYGKQLFPGSMHVRFPQPWKGDAPYYIIGTDYIHYAVVVSCKEFGLLHGKTVWILTRDRHPRLVHMKKAYRDIEHANLSLVFLEKTDQKHCDVVRPSVNKYITGKH